MRKQIKKIGRAVGIVFTKEELIVYKLAIGKIVDLEVTEVKK
jgi:hypothetical protein